MAVIDTGENDQQHDEGEQEERVFYILSQNIYISLLRHSPSPLTIGATASDH